MVTKASILTLVALTVSMSLAGCTSSKAAQPEPTPIVWTTTSVPPPPPAPSAPPEPVKPLPGIAYNKTGEFTMNEAPAFPAFNVTTAWSKLTIEYYLNATSSCYVIGSELPTGLGTGPAPAIVITPPTSSAFSFELPPGPGSCGTEGGVVEHDLADMANEMGQWKVEVTGRGQNLDLQILVHGV